MELSNINGELINRWDNPLFIDGVVVIPIAKGDLLTTYYLQKPVLISWGDEVQAEVVVGNVRIKTTVKAYQSGKKGDFIMVENKISGYRFKAMVINSNLVRVIRN
jgi:flagella basal body P-ring formation protein FlgA